MNQRCSTVVLLIISWMPTIISWLEYNLNKNNRHEGINDRSILTENDDEI